jgi:rhomboid protease GluP
MTRIQKRAVLCPNCGKLVGADESRCPFCQTRNPGAKWKNTLFFRSMRQPEQLIKLIIYTNIGLYLLSLLLNWRTLGLAANPLTFLAPDSGVLFLLGATGSVPVFEYRRLWTLISAAYLHGSIMHILFNMLALRQIGTLILQEYGLYRMFALYTLTGALGFLISVMANVRLTIGASAGLCGLIGAALYYGKSRGGTYGQIIYKQMTGWIIGLVMFGLFVPGINNWGHGGGLVAGITVGYLLGYEEKRRQTFGHKLLAAACLMLTVAVLIFAVFSACYYFLTS